MPFTNRRFLGSPLLFLLLVCLGIGLFYYEPSRGDINGSPLEKEAAQSSGQAERNTSTMKTASTRIQPVDNKRPDDVMETKRKNEWRPSGSKYRYILDHFHTVGDIHPGSEAKYQKSLKSLRDNPEAVADLVHMFNETNVMQWNRQWLIVETLGEIDPVAGVSVFKAILERPSIVEKVSHGIPNIERMIQFSAIDQLLRASALGSTDAQGTLHAVREHPEAEVITYLNNIENG